MRYVEFIRIYFRSFFIQASWNYEKMLSLGYTFCLIPFADRFIKDHKHRVEFLTRSMGFFNTHPYMANWILGGVLKLEENAGADPNISPKLIERYKKQLSTTLAAIGDQLFWRLLKPIAVMIGILLSFFNITGGLIAAFLFYNIPHFYMRLKGLLTGYELGLNVVKYVTANRYKTRIDALTKVAAFASGLFIIGWAFVFQKIGFAEGFAFISGSVLMWLLLKLKIQVPLSLLIVIFYSLLLDVVMGYVESIEKVISYFSLSGFDGCNPLFLSHVLTMFSMKLYLISTFSTVSL